MPRGYTVSDKEIIEQFKATVQNSLPFSLKVNKNLAYLADLIEERTSKSMSVSTLRRIFQNSNKIMPSLFTLDVLSMTIGYKDWNDFLKKKINLSEKEHTEILLTIKHEGYNNLSDIVDIIERFAFSKHLNEIALALIEKAVEKQDFEVLSRIFDLPHIFRIVEDYQTTHYFILQVGLILRNSALIEKLAPVYARHPVAQKMYIERFIDEEKLNGYYGVMLEHYHRHKTSPNDLMFYHTLMYQRDVENNIKNSPHLDFLINHKNTDAILPYLKMRRIAMLLIYYNQNEEQSRLLTEEIPAILDLTNSDLKLFIVLIFAQLIFQKCNYRITEKVLHLVNIEDFLSGKHTRDILTLRNFNILKIYIAYISYQNGKIEEARKIFSSFNKFYRSGFSLKQYEQHYNIVAKLLEESAAKN